MLARLGSLAVLLALGACCGGCCLEVVPEPPNGTAGGGSAASGGSSVGGAVATGAGGGTASGTTGSAISSNSSGSGGSGGGGSSTGRVPIAVGPCTGNAQCLSGICGIDGIGYCCEAACAQVGPPCGATGCDPISGACIFPGQTVACSAPVCAGGTLSSAGVCDGSGECDAQTLDCGAGSFCDPSGTVCCSGLIEGGALRVDGLLGNDGACCGLRQNQPCRTLTRAMQLVDSAGVGAVTLTATLNGGGGDWDSPEAYPIVLGWGVELSAGGVYFNDPAGNPELFDVSRYSGKDTWGSASIVGGGGSPVRIGLNAAGEQSTDPASVQVEAGSSLFLADAIVSSSLASETTAIRVLAGARLRLSEDATGSVAGPVQIGAGSNGWNGIVCTTAGRLGCTISTPDSESIILAIQGQQNLDLDAEDNAAVVLSGASVGLAPAGAGFQRCPSKPDTEASDGAAILLRGRASVSLSNSSVHCIRGTGFVLQASPEGTPSLALFATSIQNTGVGIHALDGWAEVSSSVIRYNDIGVWQDQTATIDLSGSVLFSGVPCTQGIGANTIACNFGAEIGQPGGGMSVHNTSNNLLNACGVAWDTPGPDVFKCNAQLEDCSCQSRSCTEAGGPGENMDAVYTGPEDANIVTTGNRLFAPDCNLR